LGIPWYQASSPNQALARKRSEMTAEVTRSAIVTGSGMGIGGIGRAIAARLAHAGVSTLLADADPRVEEAAGQVRKALHGEGDVPKIAHFVGDLSEETVADALIRKARDEFGRIDILVNAAGSGVVRPFLEHDAVSLTATLKRNLWTTIWCTHKALPHMVARNHGRIINIGADSLRTGIPNHAGYNAAKGGVVGLMVGLAREFAQYDITVNTVSPCVVNTSRHRNALKSNPALTQAFVQVVPKARGVEISEVADAVLFLASRECAFITGQELSINGGSAMP
jgi:2,3-dihydroxy-2,3-dihydro-p-cumate dehydrogenase